jgi:hypothetical protein
MLWLTDLWQKIDSIKHKGRKKCKINTKSTYEI